MATNTYTPEILDESELATQEANVNATRAARAEEQRLARETYMAPMVELASSDCFRDLLQGLRDTQEQYQDESNLAVHYTALLAVLPNFASAAGVPVAPVAQITDPVPPVPMPVPPTTGGEPDAG